MVGMPRVLIPSIMLWEKFPGTVNLKNENQAQAYRVGSACKLEILQRPEPVTRSFFPILGLESNSQTIVPELLAFRAAMIPAGPAPMTPIVFTIEIVACQD